VVAPAGGTLVRAVERVYRDDPRYQGAVLRTPSGFELKLFYVNPDRSLIGQIVGPGSRIGTAQDLSLRYPGGPGRPAIPSHVHVEVRNPFGLPIDPRTMIPVP
jgi:hypothetical protein